MRLTVTLLSGLSALAAAAPSVLKERQSTYMDYLFVYVGPGLFCAIPAAGLLLTRALS